MLSFVEIIKTFICLNRITIHKARALANASGWLDMDGLVKNLVNNIQVMESVWILPSK